MISPDAFIHPKAIVEEGATVGPGTRVWAFAHILPGAVIGADCNICDHVFIENDVRLGDRVTVKCGVQLWDGVTLEDDVFVGPNATFTNDPMPRSKQYLEAHPPTLVQRGASIGANVTILPGLTIASMAMVGAGAVVTHNVPAHAVVVGNPARIKGYTDTRTVPDRQMTTVSADHKPALLRIKGAEILEMPEIEDLRGKLTFGQLGNGLPFQPKRYYLVYGVPSPKVRGEHAHRRLEQILVCVHGACSIILDDGTHRDEVRLSRPTIGLHLKHMVWGIQYQFTPDAVLMVLASDEYDSYDYIRNYDEFLSLVKGGAE